MEKIDITSFLTKMVQNGPRIPSGANCVLFVYADHDGAGFDDSVCRAAYNQTKLLDGSHGNGGTYDIASTYVNFNYAVNGAFDYFNDCAFKLISCAELHTFISLIFHLSYARCRHIIYTHSAICNREVLQEWKNVRNGTKQYEARLILRTFNRKVGTEKEPVRSD